MAKRKSISKKIRFEVFKRDSFTCKYCGRKAPDVLLRIDHITPVSKGGTNDLLNLVTACFDCNAGKSDRELSDTSVLDKQQAQLAELQERREQIDMMFQWQRGLQNLDDDVLTQLADYWSEQVAGFSLTEYGLKDLRSLKRRFEIGEIMEAMRLAADQYLEYDDEGKAVLESVNLAWKRVGGICKNRRLEKDDPGASRLYYIRGILRNRLSYCNEWMALQLLQDAVAVNATIESLESHAKKVRNWSQWRSEIEELIEAQIERPSEQDAE